MRRTITPLILLLIFGCMTPAAAADKIGVVLMHGKTGAAKPQSPIGQLVARLTGAGILVEAPDMPWSRSRFLAKDYPGSMAEIDAAVARLKQRGAVKIVVGGQSMGANAALGYGAGHAGLAGVMAIAPGHVPELSRYQDALAHDYRRAKAMVDQGDGDKTADFNDNNQGRKTKIRVKARIYLSWFDPQGPAAMPANAARLKPNTALLWVVGRNDLMFARGRAYAYSRAPAAAKSAYLEVAGGHFETPKIAAGQILQWLQGL